MTRILFAAALLFTVLSTSSTQAELITFDLDWSGAAFGNSSTATGSITIDDAILPNPSNSGPGGNFANLGITSFTITVSGAATGNGTFTEADFDAVAWNTGNSGDAILDLTTELVQQPTSIDPWGTSSGFGGDFNVFSAAGSGAPNGTFFFELTTNEGIGDRLLLTSFRPTGTDQPDPPELLTFDLIWSGASLGNSATATGTIIIDEALLPNPGAGVFGDSLANLGITSISITVSGATTGNGTFTNADLPGGAFDTGDALLDLTSELVGQPTAIDPWGTSNGNGGDFNLFAAVGSGAPSGTFFFQLTTNEGTGDDLVLTNFTPVVTEPVILGDVNRDGTVSFADIGAFISVLSGGGFQAEADTNEDGDVDFSDIGVFITLLSS